MKYPWEKKDKLEKNAGIDLATGEELSEDAKNWPDEIFDKVTKKFPFLSGYPLMLKVDKKDNDSKSAFLYIIIKLSEDKKIGIPALVLNETLMPVFALSYKDRFFPITKKSIEQIQNDDAALGAPSEKPKLDLRSPWKQMQKFLHQAGIIII